MKMLDDLIIYFEVLSTRSSQYFHQPNLWQWARPYPALWTGWCPPPWCEGLLWSRYVSGPPTCPSTPWWPCRASRPRLPSLPRWRDWSPRTWRLSCLLPLSSTPCLDLRDQPCPPHPPSPPPPPGTNLNI